MKVLFTRDLSTANNIIKYIAYKCEVGILSIRKKEISESMSEVSIFPVEEKPEWLIKLVTLFNSETVPPVYLSGFRVALNEFKPDVLVLMECNRLDLFQALRYKKQNPECRLVLWTETKRLPKSWLTHYVMKVFLWIVLKNLPAFSNIITYTNEGEQFWRKLINNRLPVSTIPAAIEIEYMSKNTKGFAGDCLRILMNARFVPYKNHYTLVKALSILKERGVNFSAYFIGQGDKSSVEKILEETDLVDKVNFLQPVTHHLIKNIYIEHDVLVLPSYNEALGLVVPEAMACGIPTVTSDSVGANTYVKEGETGFIFPTGNAVALADVLEKMADKQLLAAMGKAASDHIHNNFTIETLGEKLIHALDTSPELVTPRTQ